MLEHQSPLVALPVIRHRICERSHSAIGDLDVARIDHVDQQLVHRPDRPTESPGEGPLGNVRAAPKLNDEQLTELAVRPLLDALQSARSPRVERRPARQFSRRTVVRRRNIVAKQRGLMRMESEWFRVGCLGLRASNYTSTLSVTGRI